MVKSRWIVYDPGIEHWPCFISRLCVRFAIVNTHFCNHSLAFFWQLATCATCERRPCWLGKVRTQYGQRYIIATTVRGEQIAAGIRRGDVRALNEPRDLLSQILLFVNIDLALSQKTLSRDVSLILIL